MFPSFELFGKEISMYAIAALCGILCAGFFAAMVAKKRTGDYVNMIYTLLIACIGLFIGGHLLYAVVNYELLFRIVANLDKAPSFKEAVSALAMVFGGAVFYGGLLGGLAAGLIYLKKAGLDVGLYSDMSAPVIPLFHTFGRIGCFLGGCCYGVPSECGFIFTHSPAEGVNGVRRFPIQLVESAFCLLLFLLLWYLLEKGRLKNRLLCLYLTCYPIGRFILEFWRGDEYRGRLWGLSTSQWISVLLVVTVSAYWIISAAKKRKAAKQL